ncbi:hypothetical protein FOYG_08455 [Fusarium oxysporum NRRL 32931]|uniref:Uncharacterized protein n=1 Tax=Fusarium oxysporum NRRL 32931 TaxID=660029 RepID=W9IEL5_FUSOX|nr:hypothetical protein FOYG_08455 [Fusarium oxysporum NRRL 32931]
MGGFRRVRVIVRAETRQGLAWPGLACFQRPRLAKSPGSTQPLETSTTFWIPVPYLTWTLH